MFICFTELNEWNKQADNKTPQTVVYLHKLQYV